MVITGRTRNALALRGSRVRIPPSPLPICRCGGTGRRPGLKIPWVVIPVPVRFRLPALNEDGCKRGCDPGLQPFLSDKDTHFG